MSGNISIPYRQVLLKFLLLCVLLFGYFLYLVYEYDLLTGGVAALLTWNFFVLCTPIADAGFLLDFPLRLLFGIPMLISEIVVWAIAIGISIYALIYGSSYYDTTIITKLFREIILTPYPYWGIIILSGIGTFLSVNFGDELMDVLHHKHRDFFHSHHFKHELILLVFFIVIIFAYYELIIAIDINDVF